MASNGTVKDNFYFLKKLTEEQYRNSLEQKKPSLVVNLVYKEEEIKPGQSFLDGDFFYEMDGKKSPTLTYHEFVKWKKAVIKFSYVSILLQIVVAIVAIVEGLKVDSAGTLGFGIETLMDIGTTVVVIWHFNHVDEILVSKQKEKITVSILGAMMCLFSIGAIIKTGYNLGTETRPYNEFKLLLISSASTILFIILGWIKLYMASQLGSISVLMDAICTFATSAMGGALIIGLTVYHFTNLWFLDGIVGLVISLFMFVYGVRSIWKNRTFCVEEQN